MNTAMTMRATATHRVMLASLLVPILLSALAADLVAADSEFVPDSGGFQRIIAPFFKQHCVRCHAMPLRN